MKDNCSRGSRRLRLVLWVLLGVAVAIFAWALNTLVMDGREPFRDSMVIASLTLCILFGALPIAQLLRASRLVLAGIAVGLSANLWFLLAQVWFAARGEIDVVVDSLWNLSNLVGFPGIAVAAALGDLVPRGHEHQLPLAFAYSWARFSLANCLAWGLFGLLVQGIRTYITRASGGGAVD